MTSTTASTGNGPSLTLADVDKALQKLQSQQPSKWVLIAPDGRCWAGENPMQVAVKAVHGVNIDARMFDHLGNLNLGHMV